jgi:hypothetical protein
MNSGKYVFAQLVEFLPQRAFDRIVSRYHGDKYVRHFSCWDQLQCMIGGQLNFVTVVIIFVNQKIMFTFVSII